MFSKSTEPVKTSPGVKELPEVTAGPQGLSHQARRDLVSTQKIGEGQTEYTSLKYRGGGWKKVNLGIYRLINLTWMPTKILDHTDL